jgi:hypothetical protein
MSLADVTAALAADLAGLRREHAALAAELERTVAAVRERDRRIGRLTDELRATTDALAAVESERAAIATELDAARAAARAAGAQRDAARRLAWALTEQVGMVEMALGRGWWRPLAAPRPLLPPDEALVITVALGLPRSALAPIVRMVRAQAAQSPLLLVVDRELNGRLDPAPAQWLRVPRARDLRHRLAVGSEAYLRRRLDLLIEALRPATVVRLGPLAARLVSEG